MNATPQWMRPLLAALDPDSPVMRAARQVETAVRLGRLPSEADTAFFRAVAPALAVADAADARA
jgi:hypothetical protein